MAHIYYHSVSSNKSTLCLSCFCNGFPRLIVIMADNIDIPMPKNKTNGLTETITMKDTRNLIRLAPESYIPIKYFAQYYSCHSLKYSLAGY